MSLLQAGEGAENQICGNATEASQAILRSLKQSSPGSTKNDQSDEINETSSRPSSQTGMQKLLDLEKDDLINQEKAVLKDVVALLKDVRSRQIAYAASKNLCLHARIARDPCLYSLALVVRLVDMLCVTGQPRHIGDCAA